MAMNNYRADIDGLRAIAIVPVVLFHMGVGGFSGGYIGVDVFFVISGYLITSIILPQISRGEFSILRFYERRARRILPALFFMILLSIPVSYFIFVPHQIKDFSQSIVAASLFLSNYFFYFETDYFNPFTNHAPLLHTWSLAVEEQFYIFFPPLLIALYRMGNRWLTISIAVIGLCSLLSSIYLVETNKSLAFYSIHTRAWELAVGALAAINHRHLQDFLLKTLSPIPTAWRVELPMFCAFLAVTIPIFIFDSGTSHPALPTAVPVLGVAVILLLGDKSSLIHSLLSSRIAVTIGLLSYSLYIFHQPILSFFYFSEIDKEQPLVIFEMLLLTLLVSWFSYNFIEKPLRYNRGLTRRVIFISATSAICVFSLAGLYGHYKNGFLDYFRNKYLRDGGTALVDVDAERSRIDNFYAKLSKFENGDRVDANKRRILVLGDSMGNDAYLSLAKLTYDDSSLPFVVNYFRIDDECIDAFIKESEDGVTKDFRCEYGNFKLKDSAEEIRSSDIVVLASLWQETTYGSALVLADFLLNKNPNLKIYISGAIIFRDITSISMKMAKMGMKPEDSKEYIYKTIRYDRLHTSEKLKNLVMDDSRLSWIEKSDFFCDLRHHSCDLFGIDGEPKIWDNAHLTYRTYSAFGGFLRGAIEEIKMASNKG